MDLVRPTTEHLPGYQDALRRGWSPSTERALEGAEELALTEIDPDGFLARADDPEGLGPAVTLPDGSTVPRLPGFVRWIWDGEFAGAINARWRPGSTDLPPTCLGHIGYTVVPWKRRRGYATAALGLLLPEVRAVSGLPFVDLTTDADNIPSQRVITANGGVLVERFTMPAQYGGRAGLLFRIELA